jgi:hypothetical protein
MKEAAEIVRTSAGGRRATTELSTEAGDGTPITDNGSPAKTGRLDQALRMKATGEPALNLGSLYILDTSTGVSIPLSSIFQVVGGELCLKLALKVTDGTNKGVMSMQYDSGSGKFYPTSTYLEA